ncbi:D-alanyl-D-alanine carboxypeptidase family protein [Streptomyces zingiberis]|uniref:D-alanyl-D-alanine carboxypeptidase n=1 Tax=Streptomyces zingiberis TaxID=2053010 RepID=A0ABX1BTZ4_9ACTN|nr:serine hydrolase [Streptomyces zingiberis]NJP99334.1 D-alanyl-D-alanine carboxypeptidase [Streptomyces zingiberis]
MTVTFLDRPAKVRRARTTGTSRRRRAAVVVATAAALAVPAAAAPAYAAPDLPPGGGQSRPVNQAAAPTVSAKGAFLMDSGTGATTMSKTADTKRQMASTTKIATVRVVLGTSGLDLDRKVTIQQEYRDYVAREGASTADLRTGDQVTVRQLLYATMLPSGCDAAYALADTFGTGSTRAARVKSFIGKMNKLATDLGMTNTKFDSFDGISTAGDHYSTPRDLAKLARSSMQYSTFRTVVKAKETVAKATASNGNTRTYTWYNTNQLLGSYNGAVGIKTGTGTAAGPCLVFAATRGDKTLVGVVLNGTDRYNDAAKMLDYGFGSSTADTMKLRKLPAEAQRD